MTPPSRLPEPPPVIVVRASDERFRQALADVVRRGSWPIRCGWGLQADAWDLAGSPLVCVGAIHSEDDAAEALEMAVRGAGVVIHARTELSVVVRLVHDLGRLGPVEYRTGDELTDEQRRLLELLARGSTLDEAAAALHVSRRTAARRLAAAKKTLGVSTTVQAVLTLTVQRSVA